MAELPACNSDSPLPHWNLGKLGDTTPSFLNFGQGLLLSLPLLSATTSLLPSLQGRSQQHPLPGTQGVPQGLGTELRGARTEAKCRCPPVPGQGITLQST